MQKLIEILNFVNKECKAGTVQDFKLDDGVLILHLTDKSTISLKYREEDVTLDTLKRLMGIKLDEVMPNMEENELKFGELKVGQELRFKSNNARREFINMNVSNDIIADEFSKLVIVAISKELDHIYFDERYASESVRESFKHGDWKVVAEDVKLQNGVFISNNIFNPSYDELKYFELVPDEEMVDDNEENDMLQQIKSMFTLDSFNESLKGFQIPPISKEQFKKGVDEAFESLKDIQIPKMDLVELLFGKKEDVTIQKGDTLKLKQHGASETLTFEVVQIENGVIVVK